MASEDLAWSITHSGLVTDWTLDTVALWLTEFVGLGEYAEAFKYNEISGDILVHLDHDTLKEIGLQSLGHRLILLKAVYNLKIAHDVPIEEGQWRPLGKPPL